MVMTQQTISPFPYKVRVNNPNERIKLGDICDTQLIQYLEHGIRQFNPLIKDYKKNIIGHWCNMMFTVYGWDFEEVWGDVDDGGVGGDYEYFMCFVKEEDATFFALKWS